MAGYQIHKAIVTKVVQGSSGSPSRVFVQIIDFFHNVGESEIEASTPAPTPIDLWGSGSNTLPKVGTECLVAQYYSNIHILAYLAYPGTTQYGFLGADPMLPGAVTFKVAGKLTKAELVLSPGGMMTASVGTFATWSIDGQNEKFSGQFRNVNWKSSSSNEEYIKGKEENTTRFSYFKTAEVLGYSDYKFRDEQGYSIPPTDPEYSYVDKVQELYFGGRLEPYTMVVKQSDGALSPFDKNVISTVRVGQQTAGKRHESLPLKGGTLWEFTGKRNKSSDVATYQMAFGNKTEKESFYIKIGEGLNNGLPLGAPVVDSLGEGKGWKDSELKKAKLAYILAFGDRESAYLSENMVKNALSGEEFYYSRDIGKKSLLNEVFRDKSCEMTENLSKSYEKVVKLSDDQFTIAFNSKMAIYSTIKGKSDALTFYGDKVVLKTDSGGEITVDGENLAVKMGGISISAKGSDISIEDGFGASIKMSGGKFKITSAGGSELIAVVNEIIKTLATSTMTPGFGAPITSAPQFAALMPKGLLL